MAGSVQEPQGSRDKLILIACGGGLLFLAALEYDNLFASSNEDRRQRIQRRMYQCIQKPHARRGADDARQRGKCKGIFGELIS